MKDENLNTEETAQLGIGDVVCSTWRATNQLRWKQKEVNMGDGTAMNISELQQMWRSDIGEEKWEAVPFVEQYCIQRKSIAAVAD